MTNNVFGAKQRKQQQQQQQIKRNIKDINRSREANLGTLASQSGALPLGHREN